MKDNELPLICSACGQAPRRQGGTVWCERCAAQDNHLRSVYGGMRVTDFQVMLYKQQGRCAFCDKPTKDFCVDHNHITGAVRGLLCSPCNKGVEDWARKCERGIKARRYIKKDNYPQWKSKIVVVATNTPKPSPNKISFTDEQKREIKSRVNRADYFTGM